MVSAHEATHSLLNRGTSYGTAILTFGLLSRSSDVKRASHAKSCLIGLVSRCRTTHEVVATSWGAWAGQGDPRELLDPYPGYGSYLARGEAIAPGWPIRSAAKDLAVLHFCRTCMQTQILDQLLEDGPDAFDPEELPELDCPDSRFGLLQDSFTRAGWEELEEDAERRFTTEALGDLFLPRDEVSRDFSRQSYLAFQGWLCERFAALLATRGAPALDWGVRQRKAEKLFEVLESEGERILFGVQYEDADDPREGKREALDAQLGERLVLCDPAPRATVTYPEVLPSAHAVGGRAELTHHFITVRPLARVLEQYRMSPDSRKLLEASASSGMCVTTRSAAPASRGPDDVVLYPFFDPADIRQMAELWTGQAYVLANVSLSALRIQAWAERWLSSLQGVARLTALIDCSPRSLFDEWEEAGVRFTVGEPGLAGSAEAPRGALIGCTPANSPEMTYYALGSVLTARRIESYARSSRAFAGEGLRDDLGGDRITDNLVARHLVSEPWFDFRGSIYTEG